MPSKKTAFPTKAPSSSVDSAPLSQVSAKKETMSDGSAGRALRRIKLIQYADFIRLCKVDNPASWAQGFRIAHDGVWIVLPPDDADIYPSERAVLSDHPLGDLSKPALTFPCSLEEFHGFILWSGLNGCVVQCEMEKYLEEKNETIEPHDAFVKRMIINGKSVLDIARALLEKDKKISNHMLGNLLPSSPGANIETDSKRKRGKRLRDMVEKKYGMKF